MSANAKRRRGQGHVRRHRGRWQAIFDLGPDPASGRRRARSKMFDRHDDAVSWLGDQISKARRGLAGDPRRLTVREYLEGWLAALPAATREEQVTAAWYRTFARHVLERLGATRLRDLQASPILLERFKASVPDAGARYNAWRVLSRALGDAVRLGVLDYNPAQRVRAPREPRTPPRPVWTKDQLRAFLTDPGVCADVRHPLWYVLAATGMRRSEALGLSWGDVDVDRGVIFVREAWKRSPGNGAYRGTVKAGGERAIDVDAPTLGVLEAWRAEQDRWREIAPEWEETGAVFTNTRGRRWDPTSTSARFNLLVGRAGVPPLFKGPHGLRHTHATHLLADGMDLAVVAARLGHTPATLAKRYAHVIRGRSRAAGAYLSEVLGLVERRPKLRVVDRSLTGEVAEAR